MRKLKLLMMMVCALMGAGQAWGQTDVTSTYLTNADFSSLTGWTAVTGGGTTLNQGSGLIGTYKPTGSVAATVDESHLNTEYCLGFSCRWNGVYAAYQQETSANLPVGYYELSFDVEDVNSGSTKISYINYFYVQVGEAKTTDSQTEWQNAGASAWTAHTICFNIEEASKATISFGYGNNENKNTTPTLYVSHLKLRQYADKDTYLRIKNNLTEATYANPIVTSFVVNGTFTDNVSGWTATGGFQNSTRASNQSGAFTVPFWENWNGSAKVNKMYQAISNIPNGTYRLDIAAFVNTLASPNESQYVFANNDKTYLTTGEPTAYEVYTVVTTNQIEIGLEQTTATANWMGIDNVSLRYYGAGDVINDAKNASHKLAWEEAKAAAEAALADDTYANVTGSEKDDLENEIAKAEPSTADDYDSAAADLISATSAFTGAKAVYDAYYEIRGIAVALSVEPGDAPANAAAAPAATHALNVAVYNATTAANIFDVTEVYNPSWSSMSTNSGQHWSGDTGISYADEWRGDTNPTSRNTTVTLPSGSYILMSAGRGSSNTVTTMSANGTTVTFASNGDMGLGINKAGAASFDAEDAAGFSNKDGQAANTGTGWEWRYIPITLGEETAVTVTQTLTRLSGSAWGSFSDFKILKVGTVATSEDYTALNSAISTADAKTLGFEDGEYAPYNNVDALTALAQAKEIDQEATNDQDIVQAVTTALSGATWTDNTGDVDAIYNGMFDSDVEGDWGLTGWTRTNAWGQQRTEISGDFATAYYNQPGSLKYGNTGVYTMPLAANTAYALTFSYRSHENNSNTGMTISVLNESSEGLAATAFDGNGSTSNWKTVTKNFKTGAAGNYVLTLANGGNTWMTNVSLVKATSESVTVTDAGFATYVSDVDLDFTSTAIKAYKVKVSEKGKATLTKVDKVPAGTPVLLYVDGGKTENIPVIASASAVSDNDLVAGTGAAVATTDGDYTNMILNNVSGIGFYFAAGQTVATNRAYLHIATTLAPDAAASRMVMVFADETTGISSHTPSLSPKGEGSVYTLSGQRVETPKKGLYIKNGKKVIIK